MLDETKDSPPSPAQEGRRVSRPLKQKSATAQAGSGPARTDKGDALPEDTAFSLLPARNAAGTPTKVCSECT